MPKKPPQPDTVVARNIAIDCIDAVFKPAGYKKRRLDWYRDRDGITLILGLHYSGFGYPHYDLAGYHDQRAPNIIIGALEDADIYDWWRSANSPHIFRHGAGG
jgi:hypothetical protein